MKQDRKMDIFEPENYHNLPPHQRSLVNLISSVTGNCSMDVMAAEKSCTIRFSYETYPQMKAIADLSGNSLNTVANELVKVALGTMISNMSEEEIKTLSKAAEPIKNEMLEIK